MSTRKRIQPVIAGLMLGFAGLLDGLQFLLTFIPGVNVVACFCIGLFGWVIFLLWLLLIGAYSGKHWPSKFLIILGGMVTEVIPFVDMAPAFTLGLWRLIHLVDKEDERT